MKPRALVKETSDGKLYKKQWLINQREELHRRLLAEEPSKVISTASKHFSIMRDIHLDELDENDLQSSTKVGVAGMEAVSVKTPSDIIRSEVAANYFSDPATTETWLARLIRYMTVGTLDLTWEVRHGCALGLSAILKGLYVDSTQFHNTIPHLTHHYNTNTLDEDLVFDTMSTEATKAVHPVKVEHNIASPRSCCLPLSQTTSSAAV